MNSVAGEAIATPPAKPSGGFGAARQMRFALRSLWRDLRSGELRVLALALIVAVASVTAVGFFTDRIGRAVEQQAGDVLAADLVASSGLPLPAGLSEAAASFELDVATHVRFPSVIIDADGESQLVAVKAVSDGYPLRGRLDIAPLDAPESTESRRRDGVPDAGTVWVDAQLADALALSQGETLELGAATFQVTRLILFEPDRGQNFFEFAPRVLINEADLATADLLVEGSRAQFAFLVAGQPDEVASLQSVLEADFADQLRVQGVRDGSPQMERALDRSQRFLGLASVVTVLLAGAAIALSVRHFAQRQADAGAVMRTLGATRNEVIVWLAARLALVALVATVLGAALGWIAQLVLADLLSSWFGFVLPAPSIRPPLIGMLTAFIALAGFGLLPVIRAGRVNVMRVLQNDYATLDSSAVTATVCGIVAAFGVVWLLSGDALLSGIVVLGVVLMLGVFGVFGRLMIRAVRRLAGARHRLAVAGLERRAASSVVQLAAFAMGIMALLLIAIVRVDLLAAWERDLPADAPNVFVVNIQPEQVDRFAARLDQQGIESRGIFPMVRARLVAHNGEAVLQQPGNEQQERQARREYNLTYANELPPSNTLAAGDWWATDGSAGDELSIDRDWAQQRGFAIGDTLTFRVAGVDVTGTVSNHRLIDWESFDVNFFAMGTPALFEGLPATFVTSFRIEDDFVSATTGWAREFPGIATIDIGAIISRIKTLMDRASLAVEYVFLFTLLAGVCVLLAAVQSSQRERMRESALLRALGASHGQIRRAIVTEFAILGALSGTLAAFFATLVAWSLSRFVFELPFQLNPMLWLLGVVGGALGISLAGYLATRRVLHTPPMVALKASA